MLVQRVLEKHWPDLLLNQTTASLGFIPCFFSLLCLCVTAFEAQEPWCRCHYIVSPLTVLMLQGFADVQRWYYIVKLSNKYIVSNDGVKLFPARLTPNADWTRHRHANDTASIYNANSIKKWMDPSFDLLAVDSGHTDAPSSKMRLQLHLLFPQWHPVVNHLNRWNRERESIGCGCKENKTERECVLTLGTPAESEWMSQHTIDPALSLLFFIPALPPLAPSLSIFCYLAVTFKFVSLFFVHSLPLLLSLSRAHMVPQGIIK